MFTKTQSSQAQLEQPSAILLIGLNHKSADISLREKLHFNEELQSQALELLSKINGILESSILCTCNRTELILVVDLKNRKIIRNEVEQILSYLAGCAVSFFAQALYEYQDEKAIEHIFEVACGLDSLIPGEQQITAQQKSSYVLAQNAGNIGMILNRLYQRAFGISKSVRSQTAIGRKAVSVSYAAKELSKQIFGNLDDVTVMLIGAGATGSLTAKYLRSAGVKRFTIVNRSIEKALDLAKQLNGQAASLENFHQMLPLADIVIGASLVDAGEHVIEHKQLKTNLKSRKGVAQFFIDLGVPRNFDSKISELSDVFLYSLDDLEKVVAENINSRTMEFDRARLILNEEVQSFLKWKKALSVRPSIKELVTYCEKLAQNECEKTMSRLRKAGFAASQCSELNQAIETMANSLLSKAMHLPIKALREEFEQDGEIEDVFRRLMLGKRD